jgi:DNA-binding NtrC family response regulator
LLSATNADLKQAVQRGEFREDLYYRLNVVNIHLPPLRERVLDLPLLAAHFIGLQNHKFGTAVKGFTPDALKAVCEYSWPGNIRQLKNVVEACMAMETGEYLTSEILAQFIDGMPDHAGSTVPPCRTVDEQLPFNAALEQFETELLRRLLQKYHGNVEQAAREADMNMATIYRKIKKYGIKKEEYLS